MTKNKSQYWLKLHFDRLLSTSIWKQFAVLFLCLCILLGLSYALLSFSNTDWTGFCNKHDIPKWLLPIYLLIDSNALNNLYVSDYNTKHAVHGWMLAASTITFLCGAFVFNGIIISIVTNSIDRRVSKHKSGHIHYLKSGHYIIMGYDNMVPSIINHIFEKDNKAYILILSAFKSEDIYEKLCRVFSPKQLSHIIINYGHRMSKEYYKDIHLETAEYIYIVGQRDKSSHDARNVECVDSICDYLEQPGIKSRPSRITCVFEDLDTYAAFKTSEIFGRIKALDIEFIPYNFYAGWARQVFVKRFHKDRLNLGKQIKYPTVYGKEIKEDDDRYVHLVFVGTTNFAVAFAMEAAQVLHLPNGEKKKTRISFIDLNADVEKDEFIVRNRHLFEIQPYIYRDFSSPSNSDAAEDGYRNDYIYFNEDNGYKKEDSGFLDVEFEFIKGDVFSPKVQNLISDWAKEHNEKQYLSIFLAMSNEQKNFALGMNMPDAIYDNEIPVFIRQDRSDNFVSNLRHTDEGIRNVAKRNTYTYIEGHEVKTKTLGGRYAHIYPFGMNDTAYSADETSLKCAKLINYLYCTMPSGNQFQSITVLNALSDSKVWADANEYWKELSVALKWSNLYNAYTLQLKLELLRIKRGLSLDETSKDFIALTDNEVEMLAKVEHNRWNVEKLLMGFRKPHKDEDKYEHDDKGMKAALEQNKKRFIHHDIRPYKQLDEVKELDKEFAKYIPWIIKMTEDTRIES